MKTAETATMRWRWCGGCEIGDVIVSLPHQAVVDAHGKRARTRLEMHEVISFSAL